MPHFNVGVTPTGMAIYRQVLFVANNNNYSIPGEDSVTVICTIRGRVVKTITDASFSQPYTVTAVNETGKIYVTNSASPTTKGGQGTVTEIDGCSFKVLGTIPGFDGPSGMAINRCGTVGYVNNYGAEGGVGSGNGNTVSVVDLIARKVTATIIVGLAPAALALSSDDKFLYVVNYVDGNPGTGSLSVISTTDNKLVSTITGFSGPFAIALSHDGLYAYVANFGSNNFQPFGTTVGIVGLCGCDTAPKIVANVRVGIQPAGLAVSPDDRFIYVSLYNSLYSSPSTLVPGQGTVVAIGRNRDKFYQDGPAVAVDQSPGNLVLSSDGTKLFCSNFTSNTVVEINAPFH